MKGGELSKGELLTRKSGETLIGVNIQILGTTTGTISDFDGGFQLVVKSQFRYPVFVCGI